MLFDSACVRCQAARLVCKLNLSFNMTMIKFERWKLSSCFVQVFLLSCFIGCFRNIRLPFWQFYWLYTSFMCSEKPCVFNLGNLWNFCYFRHSYYGWTRRPSEGCSTFPAQSHICVRCVTTPLGMYTLIMY